METPDLATITGAGGTIVLGGCLLTLRQMSVGDFGQLRAWIKERVPRPMAEYIAKVKELAPLKAIDPVRYEADCRMLLLEANETHNKGGVSEDTAWEVSNSPECLAYMIWLSARRDHPDWSYEKILSSLSEENIVELKKKMDLINKSWMPEDEQGENPPVPVPS